MKKVLLLFVMTLVSVAVFAADKVTSVFTLDHQMSESCEKKIKSNLRFEKGVKQIDVSLKDNTITIVYESDKTDNEKLLKAFKKIGFNAEVVKAKAVNGVKMESVKTLTGKEKVIKKDVKKDAKAVTPKAEVKAVKKEPMKKIE